MAWDLMLLMKQAVVSDTCSACTCPAKLHDNPWWSPQHIALPASALTVALRHTSA